MKFVESMRSLALFPATILFSVAAAAQTSTWKIEPAHSNVEFKVRHLGVSNVRGSFTHPTGVIHFDEKDITKSTVETTIDASTVSTNEFGRDNHLKGPDFFNVAQFPTLTFKSTSIAHSGDKLTMTGNLTLAGVTKPVTLTLDGPSAPQTDAKGTTRSGFSATGTIKRTDFNFGQKYGPPVIGDSVDFSIDIEMDKQ